MLNEKQLKKLLAQVNAESMLLIADRIGEETFFVNACGFTQHLITMCSVTLFNLLDNNVKLLDPENYMYKIYKILEEQHGKKKKADKIYN